MYQQPLTRLIDLQKNNDVYTLVFDDGVQGSVCLRTYLSQHIYTAVQALGFHTGYIDDGGMCIRYDQHIDIDAFALHIYLTGVNPFL